MDKLLQHMIAKRSVSNKLLPGLQKAQQGKGFPKETLKDRQKVYKTIRPSDYFEASNYMRWLFNNERDEYDDPRSEEAFRLYLGLESKPKYFTPSQYRPTINPDPKGGTYYKVDPELEQEIFNSFKDKVKLNQIYSTSENEVESYFDESEPGVWEENGKQYKALVPGDKNMLFGRPMVSNARALGNFVVSRGKDDKGEFLSYADQYDFPPWMQEKMKGQPYKVYGRVYYPKQTKQQGGPILDPRGQWAHPGQVTRIPSSQITMKGVSYPVLGVGNNGQSKMMYPGKDYDFGGASYVDEYPMMQNGGGLVKMQWAGKVSSQDSVRNMAGKILKYEQLRGGPGGAPLPQYSDPKYMQMLMQNIYPEVKKIMPNASAMETGEAMDFIFNAGWDKNTNKIQKDPRAYALQEYYKKYDPSKLDPDGKWSGRKNPAYSFDQEYNATIGKLSENDRRILMNKGRDWYYKNINNPAPGVPSSDYNDTWYGRIWNTNDYGPFNPNDPRFVPKKKQGGQMIRRADGSYSRRGLWDNIRANKGSGKKPTKEMLEQERKIKAKEMKNGGTNNEGFRALPDYVQAQILSNMGYGGYYNPMMAAGGEPNGNMALGQMAAVSDKMSKLLKFVRPEQNLDPWIASKLAVMDHSADAISDYLMYGPESQEQESEEEMGLMRKGGTYSNGVYFQGGGEPRMEDYPDYGSWRSDFESYLMARNSPEAPAGQSGPADVQYKPAPNERDYPDYESYVADMDNWMTQYNQSATVPVANSAPGTASTPAVSPASAAPAKASVAPAAPGKRASNNGSIVDFLNSQGAKSDFATRKAVAENVYGFQNYTGTPEENKKLLGIMKGQTGNNTAKPGSNAPVTYNPNDGNMLRKGWDQRFDARFPQFGAFPGSQPPAAPGQKQTLPAQGVADKQKNGVNPLIPIGGVAALLATAGMTAADLMGTDWEKLASGKSFSPAMKGKLTKARNALTKAAMAETGKGAQEAAKEFLKSPKKLQKILANLDAMEIPGDIYQTRSGTGMRNLEAWKMGQESAAEQMIMRDLETQKMLGESAAEAKAFRSSAAQRAAATRAANKAAASGKTAAAAAQEARPWLNMIKEGYAAARATPLLKFLRRQEGGEQDSMAEDILEFVDPTGISSYDDVYRAWNNEDMPWWEKALVTTTALPLVGKFGKAAKVATSASKMQKGLKAAGKVMTPVAQMDHYINPASRFVGAATARGLQNAPRPVRAAAQFGSLSNQSGRFWTGADMMMGYKQSGGPVVGDEMDVTPQQLELLRQQGYQFEII